MADPFGEQWFSTASQDVLARLADLDAKVVLELGTRTGVAPVDLENGNPSEGFPFLASGGES